MNSILQENYIGELFGCTLLVIIFHYAQKWFLKDKLKCKEEFEKYAAENGSTQKEDYNYKRYLMHRSAIRYRGIKFAKWTIVICTFITLYKMIS